LFLIKARLSSFGGQRSCSGYEYGDFIKICELNMPKATFWCGVEYLFLQIFIVQNIKNRVTLEINI
jgi:hypothetical protein